MQLTVSAYGWCDEHWQEYYPEDLPVEWRLDYYANDYEAVVVPSSTLQAVSDEAILQWQEEAPAGFRFYWELSDEAQATRLLELYGNDELPPPAGWLLVKMMPGAGVKAQLESVAPLLRCNGAECQGGSWQALVVNAAEELRVLRQRLDQFTDDGVAEVLLIVPPETGAVANLQRLGTLAQLYS